MEQDVEVQQETQQVTNPFNKAEYNDINLPDQPLAMGSNMIDGMLNNNEIPEEIKERYWWVVHKDNVLGFLDTDRKASKLLNFDIIKHDIMTTCRRKAYTFDTEVELDIMRHVLETKLDRAVGDGKINERQALISMLSETRTVNESPDSLLKEGFIRKLMKKR